MNKKLILFGAAFAALATFTGCSSDEPLADVQQPQLQESDSVEVVEQGTPMTVFLGSGSSRADLMKKVDALQSFKLWAVQQTNPDKVRWLDGAVFKGNNTDGWTATGAVWPTTQKTTPSKFYGYADFSDLTGTDVPGIDSESTIGANSQSFTYTLGDGASSTINYSMMTQAEITELLESDDEDDQDDGNYYNGLTSAATVYDVVDKSTMPDLLVTYDDAEGAEGEDGKFSLNLKHALSGLAVKAKFTTSSSGTTWVDNTVYYIECVRIHGLYTSGTYTFGSGWTFNTNTDGKVVYQKNFGKGESALKVNIQDHTTLGSGTNYTTIVDLGEFMVLPQTVTTFTPNSTAPSGVYLEFSGYVKRGNVKTLANKLHYLPINAKNGALAAGKINTVVVDLTEAVYDSGAYCATPAQVGGSARELTESYEE